MFVWIILPLLFPVKRSRGRIFQRFSTLFQRFLLPKAGKRQYNNPCGQIWAFKNFFEMWELFSPRLVKAIVTKKFGPASPQKRRNLLMKRRIFAAALACAMILLSACGGGNSGSSSTGSSASGSSTSSSASSSSSSSGSSSSSSASSSGSSSSSSSSSSAASSSDGASSSVEDPENKATLTLNKSDFTLFKTGATWQLKAKAEPAGGKQTWKSSNEKVATVDEKGVVTAVANGSATISVTDEDTGLTATCIVRVRAEEQKPDNGGSSSSGGSSSGGSSSGSQTSDVDLTAFANQVMTDYGFSHLQLADTALMDSLYSGLSGVSTEQCLVYCTMMTMNNGEFVLVEVTDSKDVATVKAILQARIDYMAGDGENPGGAWYPGPTEQWKNNSRVTSNGNYVMMVVHENCDDIVTAFNALF